MSWPQQAIVFTVENAEFDPTAQHLMINTLQKTE